MFLGLALCATVAFAQTSKIMKPVNSPAAQDFKEMMKSRSQEQPVDYKASIFTKDAVYDTLRCFDFATANMTGINYGSTCKLDSIDQINGQTVGSMAHGSTSSKSYWNRATDSANFETQLRTDFPVLSYLTTPQTGSNIMIRRLQSYAQGDNGLMFISLTDYPIQTGTENINAYVEFPAVARPSASDDRPIVVRWVQAYIKFHDKEYIDYKIGSAWNTVEINVAGVDVEVNEFGYFRLSQTMPFSLRNESSIQIRFRAYSPAMNGDHLGEGDFGWLIDDVTICALNRTVAADVINPYYIDGFYGQIPQGMNIPLTFGCQVQNTGIVDMNVNAVVRAGAIGDAFETVAAGETTAVPQGNPTDVFDIVIDERGFYDHDSTVDNLFQGDFYNRATYGATELGDEYGKGGLSTETAGMNGYMIYIVNADSSTVLGVYDTVCYNVTTPATTGHSNLSVPGARWSRDNGIIPSGSSFMPQWRNVGTTRQPRWVWTNEGEPGDYHHRMAGYQVYISYVTGDVVPENFRFRGLEYVLATDSNFSITGSKIQPFAFRVARGSDGNWAWYDMGTGADTMYTLNDNDRNATLATEYTYMLPDENYKAVNIEFPAQPALQPNTMYLFGYELLNNGNFAVAKTQTFYRGANYATDSTNVSYYSNPETRPYYRQRDCQEPYDAFTYDPQRPSTDGSGLRFGHTFSYLPMIRPIVGELNAATTPVALSCELTDEGHEGDIFVSLQTRNEDSIVCDEVVDLVSAADQTIFFFPEGNHCVIDSVLANGQKLEVYNQATGQGVLVAQNYDVEDPETGDILLARNYYGMVLNAETMQQLSSGIEFTVYAHYVDYLSIDPVAANVSMRLAPNPATNAVKMNLSGVEGKVNCSIIDMSGRVIYNANVNAEVEQTIDLSGVPAGAYFVRVTNDSFSKVEKLIIK